MQSCYATYIFFFGLKIGGICRSSGSGEGDKEQPFQEAWSLANWRTSGVCLASLPVLPPLHCSPATTRELSICSPWAATPLWTLSLKISLIDCSMKGTSMTALMINHIALYVFEGGVIVSIACNALAIKLKSCEDEIGHIYWLL